MSLDAFFFVYCCYGKSAILSSNNTHPSPDSAVHFHVSVYDFEEGFIFYILEKCNEKTKHTESKWWRGLQEFYWQITINEVKQNQRNTGIYEGHSIEAFSRAWEEEVNPLTPKSD